MKTMAFLLAPAAAMAIPMALVAPASAQDDTATYQASLDSINDSGASGQITFELDGDELTVSSTGSGLAQTFNGNPYPHVAHIHGLAEGECPTPDADDNGDGIISTVEGKPAYGSIRTTLTTSGPTGPESATDLERAFATGSTVDYQRTFTTNEQTVQALRNGSAVVVVHGLDASKNPGDAPSNLVPELPLVATSPALCGEVAAAQTEELPDGAAETGGGSTDGIEYLALFGLGTVALAGTAGAGVYASRKWKAVKQ